MATVTEVVVHDRLTTRSAYRYQFTPKHHGADSAAARWLPSLNLDVEFDIFDAADAGDFSDEAGRLYGALRDGLESLCYIGVWHEQVAEFRSGREGEPWHGFPVYPLVDEGPENRRGAKSRPTKIVFEKMARAGLISQSQRRRLLRGNHA